MLDQCQSLFGCVLTTTEHHEIVGVPYKAEAAFMEMPIEDIQSDVSQQWRYDSTLRCPNVCRSYLAAFHHSRLEELLHQSQDVPIGNHVGQLTHNGGMRQVVEEAGDVSVEHMAVPLLPDFQDFLNRLMAASSGSEAIGMIVKLCLKDRVQETS